MRRAWIIKTKHYTQVRNVNVFAEFKKSVHRQIQENRELQKDIKLLSQKQEQVSELEALKNAKQAFSATSQATSSVFKAVGNAVDATLENDIIKATGKIISKTAGAVADVSHKVADPIMDTQAAKTVTSGLHQIKRDVVGTRSAYWAEYRPKEVRDKERAEIQEEKERFVPLDQNGLPIKNGPLEENDESTGMVMHRSGRISMAWTKFTQESPIGQALHNYGRKMEESDNPFLRFWRGLKEKTTLNESEISKTIRALKMVQPDFDQHVFLKEVANFMIPDLLEAYLSADVKTLKNWTTEGTFAKMTAEFEMQKKAGLVAHCKLIDFRNVELSKLTLLDDDIPVALIHFQTSEILCFKNKKGENILGAEDNIVYARYVVAFTKKRIIDPDSEIAPGTDGWVLMDWMRVAQ